MYRHFWRRGMKPAKFNHKMLPLIYQQKHSYWILSYFRVHVRPPVSMFRWLIYWHYRELNNVLFKLIKHRMHSIILKFYLKCTLNFQHNRIQNLNLEGHWWRLVSSFFMIFSTVSRKNYCEHWSIPTLRRSLALLLTCERACFDRKWNYRWPRDRFMGREKHESNCK